MYSSRQVWRTFRRVLSATAPATSIVFTKKYTTEAATHGRMSDSVNAAEVDWLCNQSGLPPSTAYARPAAERASTF